MQKVNDGKCHAELQLIMQPWPGEPICHLHHLIVQIKSAVETTYRSIMVELVNNILPQNGNSQRPELHANTFACKVDKSKIEIPKKFFFSNFNVKCHHVKNND
ncbi:hypothetical protein T01_10118 [Trichinella spiralis]|uniref:Uncharacterized protein n=1 Tax=Trichinella spiralis TaxID=6334 RepID=A0A0V1B1X4_TRISP|nr:hypothetical protein T01_10118 [Trichinella spiralis]